MARLSICGRSERGTLNSSMAPMSMRNSLVSPILAMLLFTGVGQRVNCQTVDATEALAALQEKVLSKGPNGEEPSPASCSDLRT